MGTLNNKLLNFPTAHADIQNLDIIASSAIEYARNLKDSPFVWRCGLPELKTDRDFLKELVKQFVSDMIFYDFEDIRNEQFPIASDIGIVSEERPLNVYGAIGLQVPGNISALIHAQEHLHIKLHRIGSFTSEDLNYLLELDRKFEEEVHWAFTEDDGYISTHKDRHGSMLMFSAKVFLPAIFTAGIWDRVAHGLISAGIHVNYEDVSNNGETKPNNYALGSAWVDLKYRSERGKTEKENFLHFAKSLDTLIESERKARERSSEDIDIRIIDRAQRAKATVPAVYFIQANEAKELLSWLRYGLLLKIINNGGESEILQKIDKLLTLNEKHSIRLLAPSTLSSIEDILEEEIRANNLRHAFSNLYNK